MPGAGDDSFNLGLLGAEGLPLTKEEVDAGHLGKNTFGLRLTAILKGGPAEAAELQKGDLILGAGRLQFDRKHDPLNTLVEAMEYVATKKDAKFDLTIVRDGKPKKVPVTLPFLGPHSKTCPLACDRCEKMASESLAWLAKHQGEGGSFPSSLGGMNGHVVVTCLAGLAFMASGSTPDEGPYAKNIVSAAKYVAANCVKDEMAEMMPKKEGGPNWSQVNWPLTYAPLFLGEYLKKKDDPGLRKALQKFATELVQNQEATGGWAHGPGGPNALDYVELEIMSNFAVAALGIAKDQGCDVPEGALQKGVQYIVDCTSGGGVAYSTRQGQKGYGEAGRTSGAIFAFARNGLQRTPTFKPMCDFFRQNMETIPTGHVSPVMHFLTASLAAQETGPADWEKFMKFFRVQFMGDRRPDGSFTARPTKETVQLHSNTDRQIGLNWTTATYLIILQLPQKKLSYLGAGPGKAKSGNK